MIPLSVVRIQSELLWPLDWPAYSACCVCVARVLHGFSFLVVSKGISTPKASRVGSVEEPAGEEISGRRFLQWVVRHIGKHYGRGLPPVDLTGVCALNDWDNTSLDGRGHYARPLAAVLLSHALPTIVADNLQSPVPRGTGQAGHYTGAHHPSTANSHPVPP